MWFFRWSHTIIGFFHNALFLGLRTHMLQNVVNEKVIDNGDCCNIYIFHEYNYLILHFVFLVFIRLGSPSIYRLGLPIDISFRYNWGETFPPQIGKFYLQDCGEQNFHLLLRSSNHQRIYIICVHHPLNWVVLTINVRILFFRNEVFPNIISGFRLGLSCVAGFR